MWRQLLLLLSLFLSNEALLPTSKRRWEVKKRIRAAKKLKYRKKKLFPPPPPLPLVVAAPILAPAAGYLAVMGAPVYGQDLLPGTGGLLDFDSLTPRVSTNEYLVAPANRCASFTPDMMVSGGGGGGSRRGPDSPQYEVPVDELQRLFLNMVEEQYILKQYAQPTTSSKPEERRFVFVQRTPLLRFPDVINVQFLALPSDIDDQDIMNGRSTFIVHSGSVYGFDDLGKNRERVTDWLQRLDDSVMELKMPPVMTETAAEVPNLGGVEEASLELESSSGGDEIIAESPETFEENDNVDGDGDGGD